MVKTRKLTKGFYIINYLIVFSYLNKLTTFISGDSLLSTFNHISGDSLLLFLELQRTFLVIFSKMDAIQQLEEHLDMCYEMQNKRTGCTSYRTAVFAFADSLLYNLYLRVIRTFPKPADFAYELDELICKKTRTDPCKYFRRMVVDCICRCGRAGLRPY